MKRFLNTPEVTMIGLGIMWIADKYLSTGHISYVTLLVTWLLFLQIIYKNRILGLLYGFALAATSCYKLVTTFTALDGVSTLKIAEYTAIFGLALIMSVVMLFRYAKSKEKYDESILTVSYR